MFNKILKKFGLPVMALTGMMLFVGAPKADAAVHFGVYWGTPYPYVYSNPYVYQYPYGYQYPYAYQYDYPYGYGYNSYPYYGGGYYGYWGGHHDHDRDWDHHDHDRGYRGREGGGFHGEGHGEGHGHRR